MSTRTMCSWAFAVRGQPSSIFDHTWLLSASTASTFGGRRGSCASQIRAVQAYVATHAISGPLSRRSTMSQETVSVFPWLRLNSGTRYRSADRGRAALARSGFGSDDGELNLRRRRSKVIRSPVQWDRCVNLRRGRFKLNISLPFFLVTTTFSGA